jgi:hypothetical protein
MVQTPIVRDLLNPQAAEVLDLKDRSSRALADEGLVS